MCATCGCSTDKQAPLRVHSHEAESPRHAPGHEETVRLEEAILSKNDAYARKNREWFQGRKILALNVVISLRFEGICVP